MKKGIAKVISLCYIAGAIPLVVFSLVGEPTSATVAVLGIVSCVASVMLGWVTLYVLVPRWAQDLAKRSNADEREVRSRFRVAGCITLLCGYLYLGSTVIAM